MNKYIFHLPYNKNLKNRSRELIKDQTSAEIKIYKEYLSKLKYRVRKQKIIDGFIVDFYIAKLKLVIEIDGEVHNKLKERDKERTEILKKYNLRIIRITNRSILNNPEKTYQELEKILKKLNET
jgi:very-short-patch-repair endonuclease